MININELDNCHLVAAVAYNAGFRGDSLIKAISIARAESSCISNIIGDEHLQSKKWGPSIGLWQIRSLKHPDEYFGSDRMRVYDKLFDPQYNAIVAYAISNGGKNFSPWTMFINGEYKKYLEMSRSICIKLEIDYD